MSAATLEAPAAAEQRPPEPLAGELTPDGPPDPPPVEEPRRFTVAVDFDGVLHSYTSGWVDAETIPDPPVVDPYTGQDAIEWLREVAVEYDVVVLTTRAREPGGAEAVVAWLARYGYHDEVTVTAEKVPALLYIDDRGWRFTGRFPSLRTLRYVRPWRTGDPIRRSAREIIRAKGRAQFELEAKQARLKGELRQVRHELVLEVLNGRGFDETAAAAWMDAHAGEPHVDRLTAARAEPVR